MNYPKTKEEWWKSVNDNWPNLLNILQQFIGTDDYEDVNGKLTDKPRSIEIATMISNKDPKLAKYFHAAWWNAPDNPSIRYIPSWHILCDLCSEEHVLYDEHESIKRNHTGPDGDAGEEV